MPSLFLSHSSADKTFVEKLAKDLEGVGVNVWFDKWEIKVGDSLTGKIEEGLQANDYLGLVLSPAAVASEWVKAELSAAWCRQMSSRKIVVLPILYQDCEIPFLLEDRKCSATSFLRNWDSILEKKRANLRSISEPARLRQPPPRSTGAAHARGRAQSIREERRIAAPPVLFALLWVRLLPALYGPFCGPLRPFGGCPWGVTPPARECLPPAPPDTRRRG